MPSTASIDLACWRPRNYFARRNEQDTSLPGRLLPNPTLPVPAQAAGLLALAIQLARHPCRAHVCQVRSRSKTAFMITPLLGAPLCSQVAKSSCPASKPARQSRASVCQVGGCGNEVERLRGNGIAVGRAAVLACQPAPHPPPRGAPHTFSSFCTAASNISLITAMQSPAPLCRRIALTF